MTSKLTKKERVQALYDLKIGQVLSLDDIENVKMLARMALSAMGSEPVAEVCEDYAIRYISSGPAPKEGLHPGDKLYRHAQPAPDREQIRNEHAEWSQSTFGSVGPIGPLKHLSKEALEAAAEPGDLSEWADMQFLVWDAQRRAGITDEQITQAMIEKLAVNKQREWPEPKDGEPRLHIKEQPRKKVDRCDVCTEGARGGCGTCIFNGNFE
ncbi:TPA: DUF550 domain-containing protein [Klebsiella pneumoniae]|nr:DUF550 domain-containing protein [Klebsiella pneumoniae]HBT7053317.1 DUF550 domain-containing protein [Klebsiella pneumoniae]